MLSAWPSKGEFAHNPSRQLGSQACRPENLTVQIPQAGWASRFNTHFVRVSSCLEDFFWGSFWDDTDRSIGYVWGHVDCSSGREHMRLIKGSLHQWRVRRGDKWGIERWVCKVLRHHRMKTTCGVADRSLEAEVRARFENEDGPYLRLLSLKGQRILNDTGQSLTAREWTV